MNDEATFAHALRAFADAMGINTDRLAAVEAELAALRAAIEAEPPPSDLALAIRKMAKAVEANTAATERLVDQRVNEQRMAGRPAPNGHG